MYKLTTKLVGVVVKKWYSNILFMYIFIFILLCVTTNDFKYIFNNEILLKFHSRFHKTIKLYTNIDIYI